MFLALNQCVDAHFLFKDERFSPGRTWPATPCLLWVVPPAMFPPEQTPKRILATEGRGDGCIPQTPPRRRVLSASHFPSSTLPRVEMPSSTGLVKTQHPSSSLQTPPPQARTKVKSELELSILKPLSRKPPVSNVPRHVKKQCSLISKLWRVKAGNRAAQAGVLYLSD